MDGLVKTLIELIKDVSTFCVIVAIIVYVVVSIDRFLIGRPRIRKFVVFLLSFSLYVPACFTIYLYTMNTYKIYNTSISLASKNFYGIVLGLCLIFAILLTILWVQSIKSMLKGSN